MARENATEHLQIKIKPSFKKRVARYARKEGKYMTEVILESLAATLKKAGIR
ncbi:MAG: hypothetical protein KAS32_07340 [Candidatus Peribacteraceae bacterium]|nr:hypothetical protein [Candidatus Peribacteraceae bacterium]